MLRTERILAGAFLAALVVFGCAKEQGAPWAFRMAGTEVPLSEVSAEFDRLNGVNQWASASRDVRRQFVDTYARKELLAEHSRRSRGPLSGREKLIFDRWIEKAAVARFWQGWRSTIEVPESFLDSLGRAMEEERFLHHAVCKYEDDAREILGKVRGGAPFSTVVREYSQRDPDGVRDSRPGWVQRPRLDPVIGDALFGLARAGDVAEPVKTERYGWHVVSAESIRAVAPDMARMRAEEIGTERYRVVVVQRRVASVDAEYDFKVIEENIGPLMVHFPAMYESLDTARKAGTELDYQALPPPLHRFSPEERALELVRWSGGVFTVGDFVKSLWDIDLDYWPTIGDVKKISTQVIRRMTRWAYMEVTKKAGVLEDPDFKPEIDRKIDELLLNRFHDEHLKAHADRVTDEMVARYWEANQAKYVTQDLVGYGFIRFPGDARELAQRTYEAIRGGQDWSMAANTARRQDERVVFEAMLDPTSGPPYPEITAVAMNYEPAPQGATITEPVQAGADWVLLRVYYRSHPNTLTFEVAKDFVKRDLQRLEMEDTLLEAIERLTKEFKLEVNEQALS